MNKLLIFAFSLLLSSYSYSAVHLVGNSGATFTNPDIVIEVNDQINFSLTATHFVREVSEATWNANGTTTNGGFQTPAGGATITFSSVGVFYYVCPNHFGMKGKVTVVTPNQDPEINPQTFSIPENSAAATVVNTVVAADPDAGQTLTYSITSGNTGNVFSINASTGELKVAGVLNYEGTSTYSLTIKVIDNGGVPREATGTITVNIEDVNDNPTIANQSFPVNENSANNTVVGTVVASDQDAAQTITYAITAGNTNDAFEINTTTGQITVTGELDFETKSSYPLTITVTDNGALSSSATVTITINNLVEGPNATMDAEFAKSLEIYPSPAKDNIYFNSNDEVFSVEILDLSGKEIYSEQVNNNKSSIVVSHLTRGMYYVKFYTKNGNYAIKKIVIE